MVKVPKKATTVILVRQMDLGFEVFLLKRHEKSSFMGGNYVYPGGMVDLEDGLPEICSRCIGLSPEEAQRVLGGMISQEESIGFWVAGIRELFEEAGILLAYDPMCRPFVLQNRINHEKVSFYRQSLQKGELTLLRIAEKEGFCLALDQLHYYAHWITPEAMPQRFDTRFFLARHPLGQEASYDQEETTEGLWLSPRMAIEQNLKGEIVLSPPTLKTLEDLSKFKSPEDLFRSLQGKEIQTVLSIFSKVADHTLLVYPWDPDYEIFKRGEIPDPLNFGRPSEPGDNSTRLLFKDGRWHLYCRTS